MKRRAVGQGTAFGSRDVFHLRVPRDAGPNCNLGNGTLSEQMLSFREDVKKLREVAGQQGEVRQALRDKDDTIQGEGLVGPRRRECMLVEQGTTTEQLTFRKRLTTINSCLFSLHFGTRHTSLLQRPFHFFTMESAL